MTDVKISEVRAHLAEYVAKAAGGERFVIEYALDYYAYPSYYSHSHEYSKAVLVSMEDLKRLETLERLTEWAEQDPQFRKALKQAGFPVQVICEFVQRAGDYEWLGGKGASLVRDAKFRAALEREGAVVSWPTGEPVSRGPLIDAGEPPLSEQIIAERR